MHWTKLLALGLISTAVQLGAQTNPVAITETNGQALGLGEAIDMALKKNLDVQVQRLSPIIARLDLKAATAAYYLPQPDLSLSLNHLSSTLPSGARPSGTEVEATLIPGISGFLPSGANYRLDLGLRRSGLGAGESFSGNWGISIVQPLLRDARTDVGRAQILVSRKGVQSADITLISQIMLTVFSVEQTYNLLLAAVENVKVSAKALELAERTLSDNKLRVAAGVMAILDEKEAESQVASSRADLLASQQRLASQQNALKSLLTDDYRTLHEVSLVPTQTLEANPQTYDLQESWRKAFVEKPEIHLAELALDQREINLRLNRNQLLPRLDLLASYGSVGTDDSVGDAIDRALRNDTSSYSYGVRLRVPIGNASARDRYRVAEEQIEQQKLQLQKLKQQIMVQIDDAIKQAQTSFQRVGATRQAREFAETALDAEQKKLENGKSTSFFVLQLQQRLTSARVSEVAALVEYNNALAQLAFREGTILERHRLDVKIK